MPKQSVETGTVCGGGVCTNRPVIGGGGGGGRAGMNMYFLLKISFLPAKMRLFNDNSIIGKVQFCTKFSHWL